MQQLLAWAKRKTTLFTITAVLTGTILIAWTWVGHLAAAAPDNNIAAQDFIEAPLEAEAPNAASTPVIPTPVSTVIVYISGRCARQMCTNCRVRRVLKIWFWRQEALALTPTQSKLTSLSA